MTDETELPRCEICGEPMPEGETMFKFHGFSGPCPAPPLADRIAALEEELAVERERVNTAYTAMRTDYRELLINLDDERTRREAVLLNERERRKAAEEVLRELENDDGVGDLIDAHFSRYKD